MAKRYCNKTPGHARKVIFETELDAKIVLASRYRRDKGEIRYYQCEFGKHWHLSSQVEQPNRAAAN